MTAFGEGGFKNYGKKNGSTVFNKEDGHNEGN
jgi:hypothetical protein